MFERHSTPRGRSIPARSRDAVTAGTSVLVDARNVLRSTWPNIPEGDLVALCAAWAKENGCRAVVVFDGTAPGALVGEQELAPHCVVVGTGGETADDWLTRAAAAEERPYWLVTSDRALRAAAGRRAERTIGGGSFVRELRSSATGEADA